VFGLFSVSWLTVFVVIKTINECAEKFESVHSFVILIV
jgi:hypothetical protein